MAQHHTSANTSVNSTRIPRLYSLVSDRIKGKDVIDYGCGKFFDRYGLENVAGYDPYNRPDADALKRKYDVALCSNVLNVIDSRESRLDVLRTLKRLAPVSYISVYEGDRSGHPMETKHDCFQMNQLSGWYYPELYAVFGEGNVDYHKGYFECRS